MKANQAFVNNEEAVSPVIGVILMVAITVVLAAVVFVLVSDLGGGSESAPAISWNKDEGTDRLEIISAADNADWSRLTIQVISCGTVVDDELIYAGAGTDATLVNEATTATADDGTPISADPAATTNCAQTANAVAIADAVDNINAGDYIEICARGGTAPTPATNVVVRIVDTNANQQVHETTFSTVAVCA